MVGAESPPFESEAPPFEVELEGWPVVTTSGWVTLEMSLEAALAEGGGTVRSLWQ